MKINIKEIKYSLLILTTIIFILTIYSHPCFSCTGGFSNGLPSNDKNIVGGTLDWKPPVDLKMLVATLVKPDSAEQFKYLRIAHGGQPGDGAWINEKGVGYKDFSRFIKNGPEGVGIDQNAVSDKLFKTCSTAEEFVNTWSPILSEYGCGQDSSNHNGWAILLVDLKDNYLIEAGDITENDKTIYINSVLGPFRNTIFAQSNYYLAEILRKYQPVVIPNATIGGLGYPRTRRMWNLLTEKQFYNIDNKEIDGYIDVLYWMKVLRDRGSLNDKIENDLKSVSISGSKQGNDAICKNMGVSWDFPLTYCAQIIAPSTNHTELLSCIWSGLGFPLTSPYLPFYIGVESLPNTVTSGDKPGDFAYEFNVFYNQIFTSDKNTNKVIKVNKERLAQAVNLWEKFDAETYAESKNIEAKAVTLANSGKQTEARKVLTDFLAKRINDALNEAKKLKKTWN